MSWKKELIQELGDLCHESYLGHNTINAALGEYEYCYKGEVINLLDTPEAKAIISKYFDKLINDIPDRATVKYRDIEGNESPNFDIRRLKQQLKDKWL